MNLRQLSYFVAVAEQQSIIKAAEVLHVSQPSVSTQIKLLEEELEVSLFERRREGTLLTPEGRDFLAYARSALDTLAAAKANLRSYQAAEVGTVSVGIPGSLSSLLTLDLIERVRQRFPSIKVKVVTGLSGHISRWVMDGTLDFGLLYASDPVVGLDLELIMTEQLFLATSMENRGEIERRCEDGEIRLAALSDVPLVMPGSEHGLRVLVNNVAKKAGTRLNVSTELDAPELLLECVLRTSHSTILSLAALKGWRNLGLEVFATHIVDPVIERRISLAYASDRPLTRTARRVTAILREQLEVELARGWWTFARLYQ